MHRLNHAVMFNYINVSVSKYTWIKSTHYKTNMKKTDNRYSSKRLNYGHDHFNEWAV